jgi:hypothetical protein
MGDPLGEADRGVLRLDFNRRLMLQSRGSATTSDAVLLAYRELDHNLGLTINMESKMKDKLVGFIAAAASTGMANAKEPVELTEGQLYKVTGGAAIAQLSINAVALVNGGGVNQFSPATATVSQTSISTASNLFTVY